jgi:hypothetical protein
MASISAMIDEAGVQAARRAADKAAGRSSSKKPIFLFLKPGHKVSFRPVFRLDDCLTLQVHDKYHENREYKVNAVCACEKGEKCEHCDTAKVMKDRDLNAKPAFYIPVYVYSVFEGRVQVTYEEEEDGQKVKKPVRGFRMIECFRYGKTYTLLKTFREYERDMRAHNITACDWTWEQEGSGQGKTFTLLYKEAEPMKPALAKAIPSIERFKQSILDARPPVVLVAAALDDLPLDDTDPLAADAPVAEEDDGIEDF